MPADIDAELAQAVAIERQMEADLLDAYQREPRSIRRAVSRDLARQYPVAPKRPQYGAVARWVNRRRPMSEHIDGQLSALGPKVPRSGQARVNAKRNERAEFWRTVKIRVSHELEPYFRASLHVLGKGTRIVGSRQFQLWPGYEFDVHIPGAPDGAVSAEPVYYSDWDGERHTPRMDAINYLFALA